jgi:glucan phosphoethanolaminetransferase (alkaline phosphatase superfamily)
MTGSKGRVVIGEAIILVAWLVIMLLMRSLFMSPAIFYISLLFGIIAFCASAASLIFGDRGADAAKGMTEVNSLPTILSSIYFAVALVVNTIFCLASFAWISVRIPVVVNLILLVVMVCIRIGTDSYQQRTEKNIERVSQKVGAYTEIQSRVGQVLAQAEDPSVRSELRKLKEDVDFSSNLSQSSMQRIEGEFLSQLDSISRSLERGESTEALVEKIKRAERIWKSRNATTGSVG